MRIRITSYRASKLAREGVVLLVANRRGTTNLWTKGALFQRPLYFGTNCLLRLIRLALGNSTCQHVSRGYSRCCWLVWLPLKKTASEPRGRFRALQHGLRCLTFEGCGKSSTIAHHHPRFLLSLLAMCRFSRSGYGVYNTAPRIRREEITATHQRAPTLADVCPRSGAAIR